MTNLDWKCEQLRAGQVTNRVILNTEEQASRFVAEMSQLEPDLFWRIEPVDARVVWN
jgi:hypothetical protein